MNRTSRPRYLAWTPIRQAVASWLLLFCVSTVNATASAELVSRHKLQDMLRQGDFDALEQILAGAEQSYEAGQVPDSMVEHAYYAFGSADPELEARFGEWIAAKPGSHQPYLARGTYHRHLGWISRGGAYVRDTPDQRMDLMHKHFELAAQDLKTALARKPSSGVAYGFLIDISMAAGRRDERKALLRTGLKADPRSFTVRRRYLVGLTPWWGGGRSSAKGRQAQAYPVEVPDVLWSFVSEIEQDTAETPALRPLLGYVDFVVAEILRRDGRNEEAVEYYKRAAEFGDFWFFRYQEGRNYHRMKRYGDAIASYSRSLELWPDNTATLKRRARVYRVMEEFEKAFADLDKALSLDPRNPELLLEKAYALRAVGRYEDAVATLDEAFYYGEFNDDVWDARGRLYLYELDDPALAIDDLRRTTELDPTSRRYWYNYGLALYKSRDCKAREAYSSYLDVCPKYGNKCSEGDKKFAAEVIQFLSNPQICPS